MDQILTVILCRPELGRQQLQEKISHAGGCVDLSHYRLHGCRHGLLALVNIPGLQGEPGGENKVGGRRSFIHEIGEGNAEKAFGTQDLFDPVTSGQGVDRIDIVEQDHIDG